MTINEAAIEKEIQDKGLNAPRLTPALIDSVIVGEYFFTAEEGVQNAFGKQDELTRLTGAHAELGLLTFCVLVLKNGFTVTGESACASAENFNEEIGRKIARDNARNKIWLLEGYLLRQRLHEQN
tara:strand:- start:4137 stop:4511 length:375 start_codon:yes stop_codon:yes gene_type:complete